jgi:hypothetical protein
MELNDMSNVWNVAYAFKILLNRKVIVLSPRRGRPPTTDSLKKIDRILTLWHRQLLGMDIEGKNTKIYIRIMKEMELA